MVRSRKVAGGEKVAYSGSDRRYFAHDNIHLTSAALLFLLHDESGSKWRRKRVSSGRLVDMAGEREIGEETRNQMTQNLFGDQSEEEEDEIEEPSTPHRTYYHSVSNLFVYLVVPLLFILKLE